MMQTTRAKRRQNMALLVAEHGGQAAVAARIGRDRNQVYQWVLPEESKAARGIGDAMAREIEAAFGLPVGWMDAEREEAEPRPAPTGYLRPISSWDRPDELPAGEYGFLPHLDAYLSAGHGGPSVEAIERTDKTTPFRSDWMRAEGWSPRTHYTMRCRGDSMEPSIQDGAPVVIDTSAKAIKSGRVYAIVVDGETLLKRLDKLPGGIVRVRSDNPSPLYAPWEIAEDALQVIGRAVWTPVRL